MVNADRFDGPTGNLCAASTDSGGSSSSDLDTGAAVAISAVSTALVTAFVMWCFCSRKKTSSDLTAPLMDRSIDRERQ